MSTGPASGHRFPVASGARRDGCRGHGTRRRVPARAHGPFLLVSAGVPSPGASPGSCSSIVLGVAISRFACSSVRRSSPAIGPKIRNSRKPPPDPRSLTCGSRPGTALRMRSRPTASRRARSAMSHSRGLVDRCLPSAHGTRFTLNLPQCGHFTRRMAYTNKVGRIGLSYSSTSTATRCPLRSCRVSSRWASRSGSESAQRSVPVRRSIAASCAARFDCR